MATSSSSPTCASFDRFQVDLSSGELRKSGNPVPIQEQPLQVLRLLLEAGGKVVTREQLRSALWPEDTFVDFEHGVNTAVRKLRTALDDSAEHPQFIETLPKVGYRFIVPVEWAAEDNGGNGLRHLQTQVPTAAPPPPKLRWKLKVAASVAAVAVIASVVALSDPNSRLTQTWLGSSLRRMLVHQPTPVLERKLTANPQGMPVTSAVLSPDSKYLAYTDSTGFYLRQLDSGEVHAVPLPKGFEPIAESWLPDSVHLIVRWFENLTAPPSLWEISVMGGTPRKLQDQGARATVSPDGSKIAFLTGNYPEQGMWLMRGDGSEARKIVNGRDWVLGPAAWSPDGMRLAYVRASPTTGSSRADTQIEVYDLTNGHSDVAFRASGLGDEIAWSRDGRLIYSLQDSGANASNFSLWSVKLDSKTAHAMGSSSKITGGERYVNRISVAQDGKRLTLLRDSWQFDVYVGELGGQGNRLKAIRRLTLDERDDYPYAWTADSRAVLFVSNRDGPFHLFKQGIDQAQPELVLGGDDDLYLSRLSPDGSAVLYVVSSNKGEPLTNQRLMQVPMSGGPSKLVLEGPGIGNMECARLPSTTCVYSELVAGQQRFFTFDPFKGKGVELVAAREGRKFDGNYSWGLSPDGKYLVTAIKSPAGTGGVLRILSLSHSGQRLIAVPGWPNLGGLDWAADSKSVWVGANHLWWGCDKQNWVLLRIDLSGNVTAMPENNYSIGSAVPSPDGRYLALFVPTRISNVWLLENF